VSVLPDIRPPATRRVNGPLPAPADIKLLLSTRAAYLRRPSTERTAVAAAKRSTRKPSGVAPHLSDPCQDLLDLQHGVIARWQAAEAGLNSRLIDPQLHNGRWQTLYRGVYATFTGQPSRMAVLWAAVLRGGPGAALGYHTAAEVDGLVDRPSTAIHVLVSSSRRVTFTSPGRQEMPRVVIHYRARAQEAIHPSRMPPRTRVEETAVDLTQVAASLDEAFSWLARACSRRLTTAILLRAAMEARPKLRWRTQLSDALIDVGNGVHSVLEWRYLRDVELRHGLPRADRQAVSRAGKRTRYLDNRYRRFGVLVELDGRAAHPAESRWRDVRRDNASAAMGMVTLRYGWTDVTEDPCRVASEIADVLRQRGWTGRIRACGPACRAAIS
jgi:very-short-patch-repair endonuclease